MDKIGQQISRFESLDMVEIFKQAVLATKESLLGHIKFQMLEGKGSDNKILGVYKFDWYANDKDKYFGHRIAPYGIYDFKLTGEFQDAMYIGFDLYGNIIIGSSDWKTEYLEMLAGSGSKDLGGQRTFALNKETLEEYSKTQLLPEIQKLIRQHLGYAA